MRVLRIASLLAGSALLAAPAIGGWLSFDEADGVPASGVTSVVVDGRKNLWVGTTRGGLAAFDGVDWTHFGAARDLPSDEIHALAATTDGDVWVGTSSGAARHRQGVWTRFGEPRTVVTRLAEAPDGALWALTADAGVVRYEDAGVTTFLPGLGAGLDLVVEPSGRVTVLGSGGLHEGDEHGFTPLDLPAGIGNPRFLALDATGTRWLAGASGTARRTGGTWEAFLGAGTPGSTIEITALEAGGDEAIWVGTRIGAYRFEEPGWTWFNEAERIPFGEVTTILAGPRGETWFAGAGSRDGVSRFDGWSWQVFRVGGGLGEDAITAMALGPDNSVWTGSAAPASSVSRFDGEFWDVLGLDEGIPGVRVDVVRTDPAGDLWIGADLGLARLTAAGVVLESTVGLTGRSVRDLRLLGTRPAWIATDREAASWSGSSWVPRMDTESFALETTSEGTLVGTIAGAFVLTDSTLARVPGIDTTRSVRDILAVPRETWIAQDETGVHRFEGLTLVGTLNQDLGLVSNSPRVLLARTSGELWIGTDQGVSVFDGMSFTNYRDVAGLSSNGILSLFEDSDTLVWIGTSAGVTRHDGQEFLSYGPADGLAGSFVNAIAEDPVGNLVFGGDRGLTRHGEDRVPPRTVIRPRLPAVSPSPRQTVAYLAGFADTGIEFQWRRDGEPWSPWQTENFVVLEKLDDGVHVFDVRGRDRLGNEEQIPASVTFEIDSSPPSPSIISPVFGQAVSGIVDVTGTVSDPRLQGWILELARPATPGGDPEEILLASAETPVVNGVFHAWDTAAFPDGNHELRLYAFDTLGLSSVLTQAVIIDNEAPFAAETTPVRIRSGVGGDVWTTNREAHLYVPPGALSEDAVVSLRQWFAPPTGVVGIELKTAWRIGLDRGTLHKPLVLDVSLAGNTTGLDSLRFSRHDQGQWTTLGGSPTDGGARFAVSLSDTGGVALFVGEPGVSLPAPPLSALRLVPRAFSPAGGTGSPRAAISFTLGSPGSASVRVYNRAGRVVRVVAEDGSFTAGTNLVHWDGRDEGGSAVPDGLYLVSVEAHGERLVETLAVVR